MMRRNSWRRRGLAVASVLLLSVPSAVGVQRALAPTRGDLAAWLAAAGFEAVYLAVALLALSSALRRAAQRIALAAVATAISLNALADYAARVPGGLASAAEASARFDALALALALGESVPLAALAYAMATLLHRLAEADDEATMTLARALSYPPPVPHDAPLDASDASLDASDASLDASLDALDAHDTSPDASDAPRYACPSCGAPLASAQAAAAAARWHRCPACRPSRAATRR